MFDKKKKNEGPVISCFLRCYRVESSGIETMVMPVNHEEACLLKL